MVRGGAHLDIGARFFSLRFQVHMKNLFCRLGALCVAAVLIAAASGQLVAQVTPGILPPKSVTPEELSQAELLKSYLQVREQLQAAQLAMASSRIEAEVTARAQAAAVGDKLEAIRLALDAERERDRLEHDGALAQQAELDRRERDQHRSNRLVIWVAGVFGVIGLAAIVVGPILQWRAVNRLSQVLAARPLLTAPLQPALLANESATLPDQAVTVSNQRVQAMIERMEKRILELEHTAAPPASSAGPGSTSTILTMDPPPRPADEFSARIRVLLGKGHALLAAGKAKEAVACYNEVLKVDLNHPEALVKRGAALESLKQDDEAIQCYDRAIKADAKMTLAYLYKGGVCNRLERYEEASRCYEQALRTEDESRAATHA